MKGTEQSGPFSLYSKERIAFFMMMDLSIICAPLPPRNILKKGLSSAILNNSVEKIPRYLPGDFSYLRKLIIRQGVPIA